MRQVLQHNQEVNLKVKGEAEFGGRIEYAIRSQEIPAWRLPDVRLSTFLHKISKGHHQYQKITETYGDPNNLQGNPHHTYLDPVELLDNAQGVNYHPHS